MEDFLEERITAPPTHTSSHRGIGNAPTRGVRIQRWGRAECFEGTEEIILAWHRVAGKREREVRDLWGVRLIPRGARSDSEHRGDRATGKSD